MGVALMLAGYLFSVYYFDVPRWVCVVYFVFWRCMYNLGMGALLSYQSTHRSYVRWFERTMAKPHTWMARLLRYLAQGAVPKGSVYDVDTYPAPFSAWLVWRQGVTVILCHDGITFGVLGRCHPLPLSVLCFAVDARRLTAGVVWCGVMGCAAARSFSLPQEWTWIVVLQYVVGVVFSCANYWAKFDAHRCLGLPAPPPLRCAALRCNAMQCNAMQCNAMQCAAMQCK
jgi:hypothetical protein